MRPSMRMNAPKRAGAACCFEDGCVVLQAYRITALFEAMRCASIQDTSPVSALRVRRS
ncbi:hypothetical protein XFF6992_80118 [Xanthomonas citri pv. fuscans]|nr:hypothetical protein XFF6992_80118 [Xanthomonas citri pv. fuscans]SOO35552.1 hypothetical protein XFF6994_5440006 [Xanthomonas citri pv. fuscans]